MKRFLLLMSLLAISSIFYSSCEELFEQKLNITIGEPTTDENSTSFVAKNLTTGDSLRSSTGGTLDVKNGDALEIKFEEPINNETKKWTFSLESNSLQIEVTDSIPPYTYTFGLADKEIGHHFIKCRAESSTAKLSGEIDLRVKS